MKNLTIAALVLTHSCYPKDYCYDKDCYPVPCAEIHAEPDVSVRFGRLFFPPNMIHESSGTYCHVCTSVPNAKNLSQITQCVLVPQATS